MEEYPPFLFTGSKVSRPPPDGIPSIELTGTEPTKSRILILLILKGDRADIGLVSRWPTKKYVLSSNKPTYIKKFNEFPK